MHKIIVFSLFAFCFVTAPAMTGWMIRYDNSVTTQVQDDKIRTDIGDTVILMDPDEGALTAINSASPSRRHD